jgi:methyl-accepting chemotaxis protein
MTSPWPRPNAPTRSGPSAEPLETLRLELGRAQAAREEQETLRRTADADRDRAAALSLSIDEQTDVVRQVGEALAAVAEGDLPPHRRTLRRRL